MAPHLDTKCVRPGILAAALAVTAGIVCLGIRFGSSATATPGRATSMGIVFLTLLLTVIVYKGLKSVCATIGHSRSRLDIQALALQNMAEGMSVCNSDGIILFTNPAFDGMFGYRRGELLGKHVTVLNNLSGEDNERIFRDVSLQLAATGTWSGEFENRKADGTVFYTHARISALQRGGKTSWISVQENITERKELERLKDEMLSAVSHEMRTPLTVIMGFLQVLQESRVTENQLKRYVETMYRETERLNGLIGNFLDMQRLRAKQGSYSFRPLTIQPLLHEAAARFAGTSARHRIRVDSPADLPQIVGDRSSLHQSLMNLLANAIKYSTNGGDIVLGAHRGEDGVVLWVQDEGIGIPSQALEKVFEGFYRVDNTDRRATGGTGLGLALVRETVHAHGGKVWVQSTVGQGSTFHISLPIIGQNSGTISNNTFI